MWSCGGKLRVLLKLRVDLGDPWCLLREVRSPFALRGAPWDSSRIAAWMNRASFRVEARTSRFLSISHFDRRVSAELEPESQATSCVEEWNSAFLWHFSRRDRPLVELYLEPAVFSRRGNWGVSAPSCCDFILRLTFEEVPGHGFLILSGKVSQCLSKCGTTHKASPRVSM